MPDVVQLEDWYAVTKNSVYKYLGERSASIEVQLLNQVRFLNNYYDGSLLRALQSIYPEHQWYPWLFKTRESQKNALDEKQLVAWLSVKLHIKSLDDWYRVSLRQIREVAYCSD